MSFFFIVLGCFVVLWLVRRVLNFTLKLVAFVFGVGVLGAYTLPPMDYSWLSHLWKTIQLPAILAISCGLLVIGWFLVDRLHSWWQARHRPVYKLGKPKNAPEEGEWVVKMQRGWGWIVAKSEVASQEACIEWIAARHAEWNNLRGKTGGVEEKDMVYQKKIYR